MRITFWGTRGSIPSPGPSTVRFGGNTPCVEIRTSGGQLVILDAGTGIRELGRSLLARANGDAIRANIFVTHAHWDHIQGLPFFAPAFRRGNQFTIWGSRSLHTSLARVVRDQMSPVVFPVAFDDMDATVEFRELSEEPVRADGYVVRAMNVCHPGGALAYRFSEPGADDRALVYVSDNELRGEGPVDGDVEWRARLVDFARGARVLVHDAMYTDAEYSEHRGWGHSTFGDALQLALDARVQTLVLYHHHPDRSDDDLASRANECRARARASGASLDVVAAAEGMKLEV